MKKIWLTAFLAVIMLSQACNSGAQMTPVSDEGDARPAYVLDIQGPIGPATRDFLIRSLSRAEQQGAALLLIRLDTPGGLDASTRDMIKAILNSPVPVATFVAPEGARAASAGTYILYASHVAAMSPATNVGAATPVALIGGSTPHQGGEGASENDDEPEGGANQDRDQGDAAADPMTRKTINDAVAYIQGLAAKRGRNAEWAESAVREAASITSEQALELGVIDLIAVDVDDLLTQVDGMVIDLNGQAWVMNTRGLEIEQVQPDWRNGILAVITSPTIAYMLLLIGVYGLILEGYNPGAMLPGVVGAICLLMALYAFQMLPVNYAGLALIILGIILMIAEAMAPSFGALGFGGIVAMVIGSIILIDTDVPGFAVSRALIGAIATVASLGLMAIIGFAVKARKRPVVAGREELLGARGTVLVDFEQEGYVFAHGERWRAVSMTPLEQGQAVVITGLDGLTLKVRPVDTDTQEQNDV